MGLEWIEDAPVLTPAEAGVAKTKVAAVGIIPSDVAVTTGDGTLGIPISEDMDGMNLTRVLMRVKVPGTATASETMDIQIRRDRDGSEVDMLSTEVTLAESLYKASNGEINASNDDVQTGDLVFIDRDTIHLDTAALGLSVTLTFELP